MVYNYFYKITNNLNGKFYFGVHKTKRQNDKYMGSGVALKNAKEKYGLDNFSKEILKYFETYDECLAYEAFIVDEDMIKDPLCYNIKTGGVGGCGWVPSKETRELWSKQRTGYKQSNDQKEKGRIASTGRYHSDETKLKCSLSKIGNQWNVGTKRSEETKIKMGLKSKGRLHTEETKIKMSEFQKTRFRKPLTEEHRKNISNGQKGIIFTEERKKNISNALKNKPSVTCPHCGKIGKGHAMLQWHFDNCKLKG